MELSLGGSAFLIGGDIVVEINGIKVTDGDALATAMRGLKVGSTLALKLFRQGKYRDLEYALPERPLLPGDIPAQGESLDYGYRGGRHRLTRPR